MSYYPPFPSNTPYRTPGCPSMPPPPMYSPYGSGPSMMAPAMMSNYPYPYAIPPPPDPFLSSLSCHGEMISCLARSLCCCFMGNEDIRRIYETTIDFHKLHLIAISDDSLVNMRAIEILTPLILWQLHLVSAHVVDDCMMDERATDLDWAVTKPFERGIKYQQQLCI